MTDSTKPARRVRAASAPKSEKPVGTRKSTKTRSKPETRKLYVLDTNILLHDPYSVCKFDEHDVYIPFVTIEELDGKKAGNLDINRNARQATRLLDDIVSQPGHTMDEGYPLAGFNGGKARGHLFVQTQALTFLSDEHVRKNDNLYLSVLKHLTDKYPGRDVVMVTKDLNLRIKARAMGFQGEDYRHDHAVQDADLLYRGMSSVGEDWLAGFGDKLESWTEEGHSYYSMPAFDCVMNEFFDIDKAGLFQVIKKDKDRVTIESVTDTSKPTHAVAGITARNIEQRAALALLTDPDVDLVALLGPAGTGKTMLALAAALQHIADESVDEVLFTRATVAVGDDIGFLPGNEEEKIAPWLGALYDNQEVIQEACQSDAKLHASVCDAIKNKVKVRAITFMRGRTLLRKFVILDEAQNLTPKQMKTLVTRAGPETKVVCLGNLAQIDSPYLTETSSGLAYLVERFKDWPHFGSLVLETGERSRLANAANERL